MKIVYEFFNCGECPYCKQGRSYGADGKDGVTVLYVSKVLLEELMADMLMEK